MSRLIDVDKFLIDESEAYISAQNRINDSLTRKVNLVVHKKIQKLIADAPTVDAVEVVRCGDCIYCEKAYLYSTAEVDKNDKCCALNERLTNDDYFCPYGERR